MHIENVDSLRTWLTPVLEPLCDADPNALAKYVLALLKKDKPQAELEGCMAEQLDVFLGKETKPFLEKLFHSMKTNEYLTAVAPTIENEVQKEKTPPVTSSQSSIATSASSSGTVVRRISRIEPESASSSSKTASKSKSQEPVLKSLTSEGRDLKRRRNSNRSKTRSRSNSKSRSKSAERMERIRRSRSRDRRMVERDAREKLSRSNRSPPPMRRYNNHHKNHRTSPYHHSGNANRMARSRSSSPVSFRKSPARADEGFNKINSKRCRDFDEKGYCMRGETCPWDHGVDPVVLDPTLAINTPSIAIRNAPMHSEYNPDAPDLWNRGPSDFSSNRMHLPPLPVPRPPFGGFGYRSGPPGFAPPGMGQRELIPVPVNDPNRPGEMSNKRRFDNDDINGNQENQKRKLPMNARLGPRMNQGNQNTAPNCALELRKIPRGLNVISHLNDHFSKFGKITNIQIAYEGDPEAAIITFNSHAEANVAYRSTEAVLNNRFIKVFWHSGSGNGENQTMNGPSGSLPKVSELSFRKYPVTTTTAQSGATTTTTQADSTNIKTETTSSSDAQTPGVQAIAAKGTTTYINSASAAAQQAQRMKSVKLIQKKRKEQQKVVVQLAQGLYHKKQELLTRNIDNMKKLIVKLEKTDQLDPQRLQLLSTVKVLQTQIDNLKKELESDSEKIGAKTHPSMPIRKTKEQQQKELLDVELELISKEQQGDNDTYEVKKKYLELQKSLKRPGFPVPGQRAPIRQQRYGSTSVDRRPTAIKISGFALSDSDAILGHFKHFGEISNHELDQSVPSYTLTFTTRTNAEQAHARGRQFKDNTLNITWFNPNEIKVKEEGSSVKISEVVKHEPVDMNKVASDDEDMEEEERSWRRGYDAE